MRVSDSEYDMLHSWMKQYINENCIVRGIKMPGKLPNTTYTWMFYLRCGLFNHRFLSALGQMFIYKMERIDPDMNFQLSGLETAAAPMLAGIPLIARVYDLDINSFIVRKEQKKYGLMNWLEGIPNEKPILLLDDLSNSGMSLNQAYSILRVDEKATFMKYAFVIVSKSNRMVHSEDRLNGDLYLPKDFRVISLFNLDDFNLGSPSH